MGILHFSLLSGGLLLRWKAAADLLDRVRPHDRRELILSFGEDASCGLWCCLVAHMYHHVAVTVDGH